MTATTTKPDLLAATRAAVAAWGRALAELDAAWNLTPGDCFGLGDEPSLNDARAAMVEFRDALVSRYTKARAKAGRAGGLFDDLAGLTAGG